MTPEPPSLLIQEEMEKRLLLEYPTTLAAYGFDEGKLDLVIITDRINFIIDRLIKVDASPGVPLRALGAKNEDIIRDHRGLLVEAVINRLELLSGADLTSLTPVELVKAGAVDPVRLFVKNEPHSANKRRQGRRRLIMSVALVDQVIERLLFSAQNKKEIATWMDCPSAPGLGLTDDEQLTDLRQRVFQLADGDIGLAAEADVSGFDWSVQEWELKLDGRVRARLMGADDFLTRIINNRIHCLCNSVYVTTTGRLVSSPNAGVQLSGSYNTSSTNSRIRVLLAYMAGAAWAIAMGDDCVEEFVDGAPVVYESLGHKLKMYERCDNGFEFCSTLFAADRTPYPVDGTKTLYRLLEQKDITSELVAQFTNEIRNSPRREEFLAGVRRVLTGPAAA